MTARQPILPYMDSLVIRKHSDIMEVFEKNGMIMNVSRIKRNYMLNVFLGYEKSIPI